MNKTIFDINKVYKMNYDYDFLSPAINTEVLQKHYELFFLKYYDSLKLAVEEHNLVERADDLIELSKYCFGKQDLLSIFNSTGQIINHIYYFESFIEKEIDAVILKLLKTTYTSKSALIEAMISTTLKYGFGSGWLWVAIDKSSSVRVFVTPNAFTAHNLDFIDKVICCIDIWEHAYCLQYNADRVEYLKNVIEITNLYKKLD